MRMICLHAFFAVSLAGICLVGCSRQPDSKLAVVAEAPPEPVAVPSSEINTPEAPPSTLGSDPAAPDAQPLLLPVTTPEPSVQAKYNAALLEPLNYVAEKKYAEA